MKSVISTIKTQEFARVRVGIGKPERKDQLIEYVIGKIPKEDQKILDEATTKSKEALIEVIKNGVNMATRNSLN